MTSNTLQSLQPLRSLRVPAFPGAVGLTHLRVYDSAAPDGIIGGSPHVHLASAEAYVVTAGSGEVQTLSAQGSQTFELQPGMVVWFEPGVIHRLVNPSGNLEILCVMQNAGLPEAGDAVFTFPAEVLVDPKRYNEAASLSGESEAERVRQAAVRRDLAVEGFAALLKAEASHSRTALRWFYRDAVAVKQPVLSEWRRLWEQGPVQELKATEQRLADLDTGSIAMLRSASVTSMEPAGDHTGIGMCGRLDTYLPEGWLR